MLSSVTPVTKGHLVKWVCCAMSPAAKGPSGEASCTTTINDLLAKCLFPIPRTLGAPGLECKKEFISRITVLVLLIWKLRLPPRSLDPSHAREVTKDRMVRPSD